MTSPVQVEDNSIVVEQTVRMQGLTTEVHKCVARGSSVSTYERSQSIFEGAYKIAKFHEP